MLPYANADAMSLHLAEIDRHVVPGAHAVVVLDGAGWQRQGDRLRLPDNVNLLILPHYSPELILVELILQYLRRNYVINRVFARYGGIVDACCAGWNALMDLPDRTHSIARG